MRKKTINKIKKLGREWYSSEGEAKKKAKKALDTFYSEIWYDVMRDDFNKVVRSVKNRNSENKNKRKKSND